MRVKITYSEPIQQSTHNKIDVRVVGLDIDPHHSISSQILSACTGGVSAMMYKGLKSFKVEVIEEE